MRSHELVIGIGAAVTLLALATPVVQAEQTRDFMIAAGEGGTDLFVDTTLPGVQATIEHREPIYQLANQLNLRGNALLTPVFFDSQADIELRVLVLTLGASVGYRNLMANQSFLEGEELDRYARRIRFVTGRQDSLDYAFGEGRATLSLPFNDYVVFNAINTLRWDGGPDRSYDWRNALVRDPDAFFRSDIMLFFKHRSFGGFAPMFQIMNFGLGDERFTQFNWGAVFATRPGFRRANDILFLQVLFHPGSPFGGYDNEAYGNHLLFSPIHVTLAYRVIFEVWRPKAE